MSQFVRLWSDPQKFNRSRGGQCSFPLSFQSPTNFLDHSFSWCDPVKHVAIDRFHCSLYPSFFWYFLITFLLSPWYLSILRINQTSPLCPSLFANIPVVTVSWSSSWIVSGTWNYWKAKSYIHAWWTAPVLSFLFHQLQTVLWQRYSLIICLQLLILHLAQFLFNWAIFLRLKPGPKIMNFRESSKQHFRGWILVLYSDQQCQSLKDYPFFNIL